MKFFSWQVLGDQVWHRSIARHPPPEVTAPGDSSVKETTRSRGKLFRNWGWPDRGNSKKPHNKLSHQHQVPGHHTRPMNYYHRSTKEKRYSTTRYLPLQALFFVLLFFKAESEKVLHNQVFKKVIHVKDVENIYFA